MTVPAPSSLSACCIASDVRSLGSMLTRAGEEEGHKGLVSVGADAVGVCLPLSACSLGVVVDHEHTVVVLVFRVGSLQTPDYASTQTRPLTLLRCAW